VKRRVNCGVVLELVNRKLKKPSTAALELE